MNTLTRIDAVLHHHFTSGAGPLFSQREAIGHGHSITVDRQAWDDMGQPDTITITITPGDHLDTDNASAGTCSRPKACTARPSPSRRRKRAVRHRPFRP